MFGIQAIYDNMNQLSCNLSTFGTCWTQELPVNHTEWHKINKITWGINLNTNTRYQIMQCKPHNCI